jgi:hypothetical protein
MWALIVVGIYFTNNLDSRTTGSFELRFKTKDECLAAKEKLDGVNTYKNNRIMTSCSFKSYL